MGRKVIIMDTVNPDLLEAPHIEGELLHFIAGEWQPNSYQWKRLAKHLTVCSYCRTALIVLLSAECKYEEEKEVLNNSLETPVQGLLAQFVIPHHRIEAQEHERMGTYAEAIVAKGQEEAAKRFPAFAEHIKRCSSCKATLEETLAFLKEPE